MGVWGVQLFHDDLATEVRDLYREHVAAKKGNEEFFDKLEETFGDSLRDPDTEAIIWVSLAVSQRQLGRLDEATKNIALDLLERGRLLANWREDAELLKRRKAVLAKIVAQLRTPQPPPKRVRKRFVNSCDWLVGELIAYRLLSGRSIVLRVMGHHTDLGGTKS